MRSISVGAIRSFVQEETAQDLMEYALLAALISLVVVAMVQAVGTSLNSVWSGVSGKVDLIPGVGS